MGREQGAKVAGCKQTEFCGQRAGCQGCGVVSRLGVCKQRFAGKEQIAKVAGCEQNLVFVGTRA
jgi:hypothetical protein